MERNYSAIAGAVPMEEQLLQLAEECAELSQAALKLRRAMTGTNPTPRSAKECTYIMSTEARQKALAEHPELLSPGAE